MGDDDFFPMFAQWAKQLGLEDAERRARPAVHPEVLARLVAKYRRLVDGIEVSDPPVIHGARDPWYPGPIEGDRFWPSLETYLTQNLGWDNDRMKPVDESSTKVVANTPRPERPSWTCKGLVVGYVQSGKTTNYTSVIAKAADNGYKLVIVLSGMHNGLRRQTQQRLDTQLCQLVPDAWLTLTGADDDFRAPAMSSVALLKGQKSKIALCVVKKNGTVLKRLQRWLRDAADQGTLAELPVLVVDDEADQASVQTKTINPLVLGILEKLPRCTYLAYTATPFANLLIDPGAGDLYPSDFIINLPRPEGYFGTERIFGRDLVEGDEANGPNLDGYDMVRIIEDDEVASVSPAGRAAAASFEPEITSSLVARTGLLLDQLGRDALILRPRVLEVWGAEALRRRSLLKLVTIAPALALVSHGADAGSCAETAASLANLSDGYQRLYHVTAPTLLITPVIAHLDVTRELLRDARTACLRRVLLKNQAQVALLAGRISFFDLNDAIAARGYYGLAIESSVEAGAHHLTSAALGHHSFIPAAEGRMTTAVQYLEQAGAVLDGDPHHRLESWLAAVGSEITANAGSTRQSLDYIDLARTSLARPGFAPELPWFDFYDESRLNGFAGYANLRADRHEDALTLLSATLNHLPDQAVKQRAVVLADLATAHLAQGDVDHACAIAIDAVDRLRQAGYATGVDRLRTLRSSLSPWATSTAVRDLDQHLALAA